MAKNQDLIEEHDVLSSTVDELSNQDNSLAIDFEELSDELLNRNQELESLKESHKVLAKEKSSLFAKQSKRLPDDFVPPCSQCLEHGNDDSNAETSNVAIKKIATTTNDISNPSSEEFVAISDENCRLKNLLETGILKSLKGH